MNDRYHPQSLEPMYSHSDTSSGVLVPNGSPSSFSMPSSGGPTPTAASSAPSSDGGFGELMSLLDKAFKDHPSAHGAKGRKNKKQYGSVSNEFIIGVLEHVRGHCAALARTQTGSKFMQRCLSEHPTRMVYFDVIFQEVVPDISDLSRDLFGNYLVQSLVQYCNGEQTSVILDRISPDTVDVSCNRRGTRVMQKLICHLYAEPQQRKLLRQVDRKLYQLILNPNGSHVVAALMDNFNTNILDTVWEKCVRNAVELATDQHGLSVLKRFVVKAPSQHKLELADQTISNVWMLANDRYGNFLIQLIIDFDDPSINDRLRAELTGSYSFLSSQKYSSNIVEKCLQYKDSSWAGEIATEFLNAGRNGMSVLLKDDYANYVVQSALKCLHHLPDVAVKFALLVRSCIPVLPNNVRKKWLRLVSNCTEAAKVASASPGSLPASSMMGLNGDMMRQNNHHNHGRSNGRGGRHNHRGHHNHHNHHSHHGHHNHRGHQQRGMPRMYRDAMGRPPMDQDQYRMAAPPPHMMGMQNPRSLLNMPPNMGQHAYANSGGQHWNDAGMPHPMHMGNPRAVPREWSGQYHPSQYLSSDPSSDEYIARAFRSMNVSGNTWNSHPYPPPPQEFYGMPPHPVQMGHPQAPHPMAMNPNNNNNNNTNNNKANPHGNRPKHNNANANRNNNSNNANGNGNNNSGNGGDNNDANGNNSQENGDANSATNGDAAPSNDDQQGQQSPDEHDLQLTSLSPHANSFDTNGPVMHPQQQQQLTPQQVMLSYQNRRPPQMNQQGMPLGYTQQQQQQQQQALAAAAAAGRVPQWDPWNSFAWRGPLQGGQNGPQQPHGVEPAHRNAQYDHTGSGSDDAMPNGNTNGQGSMADVDVSTPTDITTPSSTPQPGNGKLRSYSAGDDSAGDDAEENKAPAHSPPGPSSVVDPKDAIYRPTATANPAAGSAAASASTSSSSTSSASNDAGNKTVDAGASAHVAAESSN